MLDITQIKSVSNERIFFKNDTHETMNIERARELYDITKHLIYATPILEAISNDVHNIKFKEYKDVSEKSGAFADIDVKIYNKYARIENENIIGRRNECRDILNTFRKFKTINNICKTYLHEQGVTV